MTNNRRALDAYLIWGISIAIPGAVGHNNAEDYPTGFPAWLRGQLIN